ncbi:hypothetical protein CN925_00835 [Bacillus sp. AFS055030]|nr:hypothetical protein CN925_00835 [Bacillus sp. AFS055030]
MIKRRKRRGKAKAVFNFPKVVYVKDQQIPNEPKPKTIYKCSTLKSILKQLGLNKRKTNYYVKSPRIIVSPVQENPKPRTTGATLESILVYLELDNLE